jgi:PilZ domain
MTTTLEAFLLIEQPRQRLGHWTSALASLDSHFAPAPIAVIAYYDPTCDQALLSLQYDTSILGDHRLEFVVNVALLAEVGMVQPAELSEGERVRFLSARLSRCTIRITTQRSVNGALTELVRRIRDERRVLVRPRGADDVPPPEVPLTAKGTRDKLERYELDRVDVSIPMLSSDVLRDISSISIPVPIDDVDLSTDDGIDVDVMFELPDAESEPGLLPLPPPPGLDEPTAPRRASRLPTVQMDPTEAQRLAEFDDDRKTLPMAARQLQELARSVLARPPSEHDFFEEDTSKPRALPMMPTPAAPRLMRRPQSEPYVPTSQQPNIIYARYLRSGRWVPVRIGALSLKGAALMAGALPRLDDVVDIALTFGSCRALVRGVVAKVSTVREAAATGASTFSLRFQLDTVARKQLTALLVAARTAKITIKPPPARANRRFPVEWQVALRTHKGALKAVALDVSMGGMFVRTPVALELGSTVSYSVVLDDGGAPIAGRARVIRRITDVEARACGLAAGFGLGIVDTSEADRLRWLGFLARIERRAEKRVLIGAEPARLAELQAGLASLGYTVTGGTDPGMLVQLAGGDARPADAVLIDAGWLQNETSTTLVESLFSARNVPCVTMHGEPRRARQAIDRLLEVVV